MANWPRTVGSTNVRPRRSSYPQFPGHAGSWGHTGKGQTRALINAGRVWTEYYPPLDTSNADIREFLALINEYWRNGGSFDIEHLAQSLEGAGGGTPLVDGASQTGTSLHTDGWPASTNGLLLAGDIIKVAGVPYILDVTADVDSDGGGDADISISPPIWDSPAENAVLTTTDVRYTCVLAIQPNLGDVGPGVYLGGLELTFKELL